MNTFQRAKAWIRRQLLLIMVFVMVVLLIAIFFAPKVFITIYPGEAGVMFRRLAGGTVTDKHYTEGINIIPPWDYLYIYDVRLQEATRRYSVLTKDGLMVKVTVSIRFSPNINTIGVLHKYIGPDYVSKVVLPEVEAKTKNVISAYDLEELYSTDRDSIQVQLSDSILQKINQQLIVQPHALNNGKSETYIIFEDLFIRDIRLPMPVAETIEEKIVAEQKFLTYDYIIQREEQEAVRKRIEAEGIKSFKAISNIPILKWRGLEVTEKLARSPNSKLVIMGTDESLPIILNGEVPDPDVP